CMLLNPSMPNTDGLTLMETMRTRNIHLPVIMISGQSDIPQVVAAIKAGALDYIPKPCDQNTVLSVVESGLQLASEQHQEQQRTATTRNNYQLLSRREKQVMELVVNGYANREIAESLGISPKTVEVHRSRVMGKMQANSLPALVNFAMELGKKNKAELA
ncbi:response regulator transcription factor, partial [Neptunomonas phycophila]|uniref:response regulator transcription factor n=2 Tax=Oceanospirillaceae TaxID=135620 RepID=UPI00351239D4